MFFEDRLSEFRLVQNETFGATIIWTAVAEYFRAKQQESGMPLPLSMLILPLTYHAKTAQTVSSCSRSSGIYMALSRDRTIPAGLQSRMVEMADQTLSAIRVGSNVGLLTMDFDDKSLDLLPKRKSKPPSIRFDHDDTKNIESAAKRLGRWFSEVPPATICSLLRVRF